MVETLREQGAKPHKEWTLLAQSLGTFYSHLDKHLSDVESMNKGEKIGQIIFRGFS